MRANAVDYVFGLARNARLEARIADAFSEARTMSQANEVSRRGCFALEWSTKESWSRARVIGKAEWTGGEANPRFLVTSLKADAWRAKPLYEKLYCARGEMENRIKECQGDLFADRTSTATLRANQLRLCLAATAYALLCALRRIGLAHLRASATCATIRLKLLKLGAPSKSAPAASGSPSLRPARTPRNGASPRQGSQARAPRQPDARRRARQCSQTLSPPQKQSPHRRKSPRARATHSHARTNPAKGEKPRGRS